MRRAVLLLAVLVLAGCASKPPAAWMLYSRASYLYGRIEAHAEMHCQAPVKADRSAVCAEAAKIRNEVKMINPVVQAELSKDEPDWERIFQYVDLVLGAAMRFAIP